MLANLFEIIKDLPQLFVTTVRELFDILSLTRQLADLVGNLLRTLGF